MPAKNNNETMASVLAKAQMELRKAVKSAENPYFKSRYAGLDEVIEACRNVLNKHGIAITQTVEYTPEEPRGRRGHEIPPATGVPCDYPPLRGPVNQERHAARIQEG